MKERRILRLCILGCVTVFTCGVLIYLQLQTQPLSYVKNQPGQGKIKLGGEFVLTDQHGQRRTQQEFAGKLMLIYFGYSFCPDICPLGLQNIGQALILLQRDRDQIVPIFITVDPTRDTPQHLALYATNFHPAFIMLTGSPQEIDAVKKKFHVYAAVAEQKGEKKSNLTDTYLMDHTTLVYLMDRQGNYLESFSHSTPPETLAKSLQKYLVPLVHKVKT